jgi:hypothetical protein
MKFLNFSNFVGIFCPPGSGPGSTDLIESGSETLLETVDKLLLLPWHRNNPIRGFIRPLSQSFDKLITQVTQIQYYSCIQRETSMLELTITSVS